ncbi:hypothetical protein CFSAN001628_001582 [Clostridium botulinum CFSAN001628]|uniref:Uncharacterized protein n=1 Tax=Clostridium botulinum (strain Okra / Type B1) TaxID=498213 RepID=B1IK35_CLOBK|nr:hypothetical protein CLD_1867 [Clostridium botulinum B1 str. Okra]EKX81203.1 hypothetical protein CFSAN001628_001582 [Clostridium botulinum CFSAN001628]
MCEQSNFRYTNKITDLAKAMLSECKLKGIGSCGTIKKRND